jgi:hypothetical protein
LSVFTAAALEEGKREEHTHGLGRREGGREGGRAG